MVPLPPPGSVPGHNTHVFYGPDQARIHDARFGGLARDAAALVLGRLAAGSGTVVDLGCGSGIFSAAMTAAGFDTVGVDLSPDMVALARIAVPGGDFRVGSVHDFAIPAGAVAVVALGEVLNYATDTRAGLDALGLLAARVYDALPAGGLFVFDVSTPGRGGPDGTRDRFHDDPDWSLGMHSVEHAGTLERAITIFVRDGKTYRRVDEHHVLRLFREDDVTRVLADAGFTVEVRAGYAGAAEFPGWRVFVCERH
jgi:SAM-dependent methyltransferase